MITRLDNETPKQYQAICDFWRLGPGRNLNQLLEQYKQQENPTCKTYTTLKRWFDDNYWNERIAQNIEEEQQLLENIHREELIKTTTRRFEVLDDMFQLTQEMSVDAEGTSIAQATGLYRAYLESTGKIFNLDGPDKIALTDPSGKKEYLKDDVSHLLKLADAAKRRPE